MPCWLGGLGSALATHDTPCHSAGITFVPVTFEALGGMSYFASIGRLLGQHLGVSPQESTHHLFQGLLISLWRGNEALCGSTTAFLPPNSMDFLGMYIYFWVAKQKKQCIWCGNSGWGQTSVAYNAFHVPSRL